MITNYVKRALVTGCLFILIFGCNINPGVGEMSSAKKPNVVLIITDDLGYGDLACHGNPFVQTPNLDNFYKECVRLTDFHVSPTCAPTRAALMTGRHNNRTGVWHTIAGWSLLRKNEKTMANMFAEAGYRTGAFGKWHLGDNYPFRAFDRGFEETVVHGGGGVQQTPDYWGNDYFDDTYYKNGVPIEYDGYCTDVFFSEAMAFIDRNKHVPFFCYLSTNAPHWPYNVPLKNIEPYEKYDGQLLDRQKRFLGMITNIDENFGRLRKQLAELEIADNTILIFMSDNGTAAGYQNREGSEHGYNSGMRGTKNQAYDGGHRVPFFIYWKDGEIFGGRDVKELTAHFDVLPTLADFCGISLPSGHLPLDGVSLSPLLWDLKEEWKSRTLIVDSQRRQVPEKWVKTAVMTDTWRLVNRDELYNIREDPGQMNNAADRHPGVVAQLHRAYDRWWEDVSRDFSDQPAIIVGSEYENPVTLTSHDWHTEDGNVPWNQLDIRRAQKGKVEGAYWMVDVVESGTYQILLHRYPKESGLALGAKFPGVAPGDLPGLDTPIPTGVAQRFVQASLRIGDEVVASKSVDNEDVSAQFKVELPKGRNHLSAAFTCEDGTTMGAYYVYLGRDD